jgi:hypothetical protein
MNAFSLRTKIFAGVGLAIAVAVFGFCERRAGVQVGALDQKIVASAARVKQTETAVAAADQETKVEVKKLVTKNADYQGARAKVELKGDTVVADGQSVVMPSVAAALVKADSLSVQVAPTVIKQTRSDSLQKVLAGALNDHIDLLQKEKKPRIGVKTGIAIGVVGTVGVVYIAVKIIRAIGHK